ncbi:MAG: ExbD/TolR family protein [Burkholderiales bacterium]|nr:ExbD/TolR family protein [Burkholderiales bacterium]
MAAFRARAGRRRMVNEINVVPYIDVMLVLLVIFMVTAPLVVPGQIDLPSVARSSGAAATPIEIVIAADGGLRLRERGAAQVDKPVERADAVRYARARQVERPDTPVVISADRSVRYEAVLAVMDELQKAEIRRVALAVKPAGRP